MREKACREYLVLVATVGWRRHWVSGGCGRRRLGARGGHILQRRGTRGGPTSTVDHGSGRWTPGQAFFSEFLHVLAKRYCHRAAGSRPEAEDHTARPHHRREEAVEPRAAALR